MIKEAIDKILSLGGTKDQVINGRTYSNGPGGIQPIRPPKAETLTINTLTGIVDFNKATALQSIMVHVVDHKTVHLIDALYQEMWLARSIHLSAVHSSPVFQFGNYYPLEDFMIALQAMFIQDQNTAEILKIIGNLKDESVKQVADNGITQTVTAKVGITMAENVPLPNPVTLRPYRTFMEIEQPESTFVFRMHSGRGTGQPPTCALFESDGRMWSLTAIKSIKAWLTEKIPGVAIIA
jgi:hypothetical protein